MACWSLSLPASLHLHRIRQRDPGALCSARAFGAGGSALAHPERRRSCVNAAPGSVATLLIMSRQPVARGIGIIGRRRPRHRRRHRAHPDAARRRRRDRRNSEPRLRDCVQVIIARRTLGIDTTAIGLPVAAQWHRARWRSSRRGPRRQRGRHRGRTAGYRAQPDRRPRPRPRRVRQRPRRDGSSPFAEAAFYVGLLIVLVLPIGLPTASCPQADGTERVTLVVLLAIWRSSCARSSHDPLTFGGYDEYLHWRTAQDLARTGQRVHGQLAFGVSPFFPGLEAGHQRASRR